MDLVGTDSITKIKELLVLISGQLDDSSTHLNSIESISEKLQPEGKITVEGTENHKKDPRSRLIQQLEEERLQLVTDIQKQDMVTSKLEELVRQNLEMMNSIKEYLVNSKQVRENEESFSNLLLKHHKNLTVGYSRDMLQTNVMQLKLDIQRIEKIFAEIRDQIENKSSIVNSRDFNYTLNTLINELNLVLQDDKKNGINVNDLEI